MLDILLEHFNDRVCVAADSETIRERLKLERVRLMDPEHLQSEVFGKPQWAWDFESLDEGFMALVAPFMSRESGTPHLYLQALSEFGNSRPEYENLIVLLEYSHYASLIEDYYNFNDTFVEPEKDPRRCSRLTQLKFAGQNLTVYGRYLLIRNTLKADTATLTRLHRWIKNVYITWGIGGGVLNQWCAARFVGVSEDNHRQNAINGLCLHFLSPIVMAAIMAGKSDETVQQLKEALSWLSLSVKLRSERRWLTGTIDLDVGPHHENALLPPTMPATLFLQKGLTLSEDTPPTLIGVHTAMTQQVKAAMTDADLESLEKMERQYFETFLEQMQKMGCAPKLVQRLADGLEQEVSS